MKALPYFRWYPADAEGDDFYASLTDAEGWTFTRLLNRSWMNDGIPTDLGDMARVIGRTRAQMERVWPKLSQRWEPSPRDSAKLVNKRQELEREIAVTKSENNKRPGNANALRTRSGGNANEPQHARARADSVCVSESSSLVLKKKKEIETAMPDRFSEWLKPWPRCASPDDAAQAWLSVVNSGEDEEGAFAARDRYLASDEVFRGAVKEPQRWLFEQKRSNWAGVWPIARKNGTAATEDLAASIEAFRRTR